MEKTAEDPTNILNFKLKNNGKGDLEDQNTCQQDHANDEKEIMFAKKLKRSDLKRLRISKDNAQKYFDPLCHHRSANTEGKGFQISFEDEAGKVWQFQYSRWKSENSYVYVLTGGDWKLFVTDKGLLCGDIVSFKRLRRDKNRFFIEWKPPCSTTENSAPTGAVPQPGYDGNSGQLRENSTMVHSWANQFPASCASFNANVLGHAVAITTPANFPGAISNRNDLVAENPFKSSLIAPVSAIPDGSTEVDSAFSCLPSTDQFSMPNSNFDYPLEDISNTFADFEEALLNDQYGFNHESIGSKDGNFSGTTIHLSEKASIGPMNTEPERDDLHYYFELYQNCDPELESQLNSSSNTEILNNFLIQSVGTIMKILHTTNVEVVTEENRSQIEKHWRPISNLDLKLPVLEKWVGSLHKLTPFEEAQKEVCEAQQSREDIENEVESTERRLSNLKKKALEAGRTVDDGTNRMKRLKGKSWLSVIVQGNRELY